MSPKEFLLGLWLPRFVFPFHLTEYFVRTFYVLFRLPSLFSFLLERKAVFIARVYFCVISWPSNTTFALWIKAI